MKTAMKTMCLRVALLLALIAAVPAAGQERGEDRGGNDRVDWRQRWENATEEEREQMREEFRKRMEERRVESEKQQAEQVRERMGMSAEDFEIIGPMIAKVRNAMRERDMVTRGTAGRGGPGDRGSSRGGDRGGDRGAPPAFIGETSENLKAATEAMAELRQAIEEDNAGDIKSSLAKLRKARTALDQAVAAAREELRSVCTAKWEAEFVVMGVLD